MILKNIRNLKINRLLVAAAVTLGIVLGVHFLGSPNQVSAATGPCGTTTTAASIKHVVWIWEENHTLSSVIGNSSAPYTTGLANSCGYATNMLDNVVPTLPSEPNYLAASSGSNCVTGLEATGTGCLTGDGDSTSTNSLSTNSIFQQVKAAGGTWRSYQEGMKSNCQLTSPDAQNSPYFYAAKHNPDVFFTNVRTDCNNWSLPFPSIVCSTTAGGTCGTIPTSTFISDVRNGTLPTYSIITPNLNNDMHGTTALPANVPAGDNWLKTYMPELLNGPNYKAGDTMIVIMWDEGSAGSTIPNVVLAPSVPVGAKFTSTINNVGFLHTTERLLGLSYLGCATGTQPGTSTACPAGSTSDFASTFNLVPGGAGGADTTKPTTAITAPANNATVSGALTVAATATDNVGVTKVELYVDGSLQPNPDTASPYSFTVDTTKLTAGNHALTTKAYDAAGNVGVSAAVNVNVQQPPTCTNNPDPSLGVVNQTVSIPQTGSYEVWSRIKAPDTNNNSFYMQVDGGCPLDIGDSGSIPANTWTWVNYQNGSAASVINMNLSAGNHQLVYNGREQGVELDRIIFTSDTTCIPTGTGDNCASTDTTPPTVSLTAPAGGSTVSGKTVSLTASASDASGISKVDFLADGTLVGSSTVSPYSLSWDSTTVSNGSHSLSAKAYDTAGNTSTSSAVTVNVNNTQTGQPDLVITNVTWSPPSPATGDQVTFSATVKNSGSAATPAGTIVGIAFEVDGQEVTWSDNVTTPLNPGESRTQTANGGKQGVSYWPATSGAHTITAWADDVNRIAESNESNNQLNASMTVGSTATLLGDINKDGVVNILDLSALLSSFGTTNSAADINKDGTVNILDLSILLSNYTG